MFIIFNFKIKKSKIYFLHIALQNTIAYNLIGCYDYSANPGNNLKKFCFKETITVDACKEKCRYLKFKYAGIAGSTTFNECYCDDDYNSANRYTLVLNQTSCDQAPTSAKYVIYELICKLN